MFKANRYSLRENVRSTKPSNGTNGTRRALGDISNNTSTNGVQNVTKKFSDLNEYFFAEDQGRYLLEIEKNNLEKIEKMLKKSNTFYEVVAEVQNDIFEIDKTLSIKTEELYKCNNQWFNKFNAVN